MIENEINEASEHTAVELLRVRSELEMVHIPPALSAADFAARLPEYYGTTFSAESLDLARRLVEERFLERGQGITTEEVRQAILDAVETRNEYLKNRESGSWTTQ